MLTDTVGFVRHLPTQLVEAFRSTLEEVVDADLLVHVVDGSDVNPLAQINAVRAGHQRRGRGVRRSRRRQSCWWSTRPTPQAVWRWRSCGARCPTRCSSRRTPATGWTGCGSRMAELVAPTDKTVDVTIPYDRGDLVARVHADGRIDATEHTDDGTRIKARVPIALAARPERVRDVLSRRAASIGGCRTSSRSAAPNCGHSRGRRGVGRWPVPHEERDVDRRGTTHVSSAAVSAPLVLLTAGPPTSVMWRPSSTPSVSVPLHCMTRSPTRTRAWPPDASAACPARHWLRQVFAALDIDNARVAGFSYGGWLAAVWPCSPGVGQPPRAAGPGGNGTVTPSSTAGPVANLLRSPAAAHSFVQWLSDTPDAASDPMLSLMVTSLLSCRLLRSDATSPTVAHRRCASRNQSGHDRSDR